MQQAYPKYADLIDRGLRDDPAFRELCEDFRRCACALEEIRRRGDASRTERALEYEQLLGELAGDVESWLETLSARRTRSGNAMEK